MSRADKESDIKSSKSRFLRLKKRPQFLQVAAKGRKIPQPGLVLQILNRCDSEPGRVGFTVTKKVGNSVKRNRIKRRLRAVAQKVSQDVSLQGYDLVLIGREKTYTRFFSDILDDFKKALCKGGIHIRSGE